MQGCGLLGLLWLACQHHRRDNARAIDCRDNIGGERIVKLFLRYPHVLMAEHTLDGLVKLLRFRIIQHPMRTKLDCQHSVNAGNHGGNVNAA